MTIRVQTSLLRRIREHAPDGVVKTYQELLQFASLQVDAGVMLHAAWVKHLQHVFSLTKMAATIVRTRDEIFEELSTALDNPALIVPELALPASILIVFDGRPPLEKVARTSHAEDQRLQAQYDALSTWFALPELTGATSATARRFRIGQDGAEARTYIGKDRPFTVHLHTWLALGPNFASLFCPFSRSSAHDPLPHGNGAQKPRPSSSQGDIQKPHMTMLQASYDADFVIARARAWPGQGPHDADEQNELDGS
ncbi:hypothetical protein OC842_007411 [Tilletia horrida]|uniref:Uncharacterized protein n=1 Tax=Tilletia horrida TaxID=155126 RepID=A0AAN6G3Y6_9BASI|nr:hypothetical protein OC842_007411 [Tilletia horrida]